ncbi:hypothetical protein [Francisella frigiditurris]|uniref:SIS domain-containing protein n=1 Tax=Francisella frigiditurris TaxID=1542390 RepID=A0A1J0KSG0_9GAMM|nr:hypothetical protein [Francisella frigiditurris]APC96712.1 hypothetical protein KX01_1776 [Francisella frigiditurris]
MGLIKDWSFFWDNREKFRLGHLTTEKPNPKTIGLAEKSQIDLELAIEMIRSVDIDVIEKLKEYSKEFELLKSDISKALITNKVFISGCGATGRLALLLESLWKRYAPANLKDKVIGFMAGGDAALVKSVEGFEDHPEYATRHVKELGFSENDLMVGVTEGGETPFVLSTVEYAKANSKVEPWLIYCNSDESLKSVKRSDDLITSDDVKSLSLTIESMALAGSTRMQATTVQTLFVGLALFAQFEKIDFLKELDALLDGVKSINASDVKDFTTFESECYRNGGFTTYITDDELGLTILTDTTERAPTFSVTPFENINNKEDKTSYCYLSIKDSNTNTWSKILNHKPRTLEWDFSIADTGIERLEGFNISAQAVKRRSSLNNHKVVEVIKNENGYTVIYDDKSFSIRHKKMSEVTSQVLLKILLNTHSTLLMGRLGRYTSNIMTYVSPANNKLIDRSTRYVEYLLEQTGHPKVEYDDLVQKLYEISKNLTKTDSIVMETYNQIITKEA